MRFPILASLIILIVVFSRLMRKNNRLREKEEMSFWEMEKKANSTRRKSLDGLDYIHIPLSGLPVDALPEDEVAADCVDILRSLSEQKIVNLTGFTNTELKLEYGAANISLLMQYDQNYTLLVSTLQKWADCLYAAGCFRAVQIVLEFAVSTHTDVSKTYYTLARIYDANGEPEKIKELISIAESLRSVSREPIVRKLRESYPQIG